MAKTQSRPARPGVLAASLASSLTVRQTSHPQKAKIDPETPAMKAARLTVARGLNQSSEKGIPVGELDDEEIAITTNSTRTTIWKVTRIACRRWVVVIPR